MGLHSSGHHLDGNYRVRYSFDPSIGGSTGTYGDAFLQKDITGSRRILTISTWAKVKGSGDSYYFLQVGSTYSTNDYFKVYLYGGTDITVRDRTSSSVSGCSASVGSGLNDGNWHHFLIVINTNEAVDTNRVKIWVDGDQKTTTAYTSYFSLGQDLYFGNGEPHKFNYFNVSLSSASGQTQFADYIYADSEAKTLTDFTTASGSNLYPKKYTGGYGADGFRLEFKKAAALGYDSSGTGENLIVEVTHPLSDTHGQSTDVPTYV